MLKIALILHLTFSLVERTLSLQTQHKLSVSAGFRSRVWEFSKTFSVSHVHVTDNMKPDHRFHIAHVERCTCLHGASCGLCGILYIDTISGLEPKSWLKNTDSPPGVTEINPRTLLFGNSSDSRLLVLLLTRVCIFFLWFRSSGLFSKTEFSFWYCGMFLVVSVGCCCKRATYLQIPKHIYLCVYFISREVKDHLNYEHRVFNSEEFLKTRAVGDQPFYRKVNSVLNMLWFCY